ncbi:cell division protein FtsK [bacterium]|nr:cell division protein FtsK [bacterium]
MLRTRISGGLMLLLALAIALSLASFNPADPSFSLSRGGDGEIANWLGTTGAYMSDLMLQLMGLASVVPAIVLARLGWKRLRDNPAGHGWLRLAGLCIAMPALAAASSLLPAPMRWPVSTGMGGYIGFFMETRLEPWMGPWLLGLVSFIVGTAGFLLAAAIQFSLVGSMGARAAIFSASAGLWALERSLGHVFDRFSELFTWRWQGFNRQAVARPKTRPSRGPRAVKMPVLQDEDEDEEDSAPSTRHTAHVEAAPNGRTRQKTLPLAGGAEGRFMLPGMEMLTPAPKQGKQAVNHQALSQNARLLESVLEDFGVHGTIQNVRPGPVVTLYELEPAPGTKSSRVIGLSDDISRSMSAVSARISVIPGMNAMGIELPNTKRETVYLRELIESPEYQNNQHSLPLALGKDIAGETVVTDLAKMPHLLVAGTTGSGKSVAINTMILSLLYRLTPAQCRFIMIDPKMLELSIYEGIPHLLAPVVTEPGKAVVALKWTVREMEQRYRLMSNLSVRNVAGYNQKIREAAANGQILTRRVQTGFDPNTGQPIMEEVPLDMNPLPYIVVIVDEMADLMLVAGKDIESSIQRLAQMARAAGIHIIMATQRPSVDVITGVIKANFPTRISFQVTSKIDSRTILGEQGAEQLLGMGDMLYMSGGSRINRVHGAFVADKEVEAIVEHLKRQGEPEYVADVTEFDDGSEGGDMGDAEGDSGDENDLYRRAVEVVVRDKKPSTSYVQRRLKIGYNRAASLIEKMEEDGIISAPNHTGKREILRQGAEA